MNHRTPAAALFAFLVALAPLAAEDAASEEDLFGQEEQVTQTTEQTQNAAPRDEILTSAVPWLTGSFTGMVGLDWSWSDVWGGGADFLDPTSYGLSQSATAARLGFVARPASDISVTGQVRTSYPFVKEIEAVIDTDPGLPFVPVTTTYVVPDFTVWSLYSKFAWKDTLFFSFGKQPIKWGTGYFFSPADDIFARSNVDLADPTAEREGPLALKVHFPIPRTMHNLYAFAVLPAANSAAALAALKPEDIAVAAKAEVLLGNTELALAGYYQRNQRPEALLTGSTGTGDFNFFAEAEVAFPSPASEAYLESGAVTWDVSSLPTTRSSTAARRRSSPPRPGRSTRTRTGTSRRSGSTCTTAGATDPSPSATSWRRAWTAWSASLPGSPRSASRPSRLLSAGSGRSDGTTRSRTSGGRPSGTPTGTSPCSPSRTSPTCRAT